MGVASPLLPPPLRKSTRLVAAMPTRTRAGLPFWQRGISHLIEWHDAENLDPVQYEGALIVPQHCVNKHEHPLYLVCASTW